MQVTTINVAGMTCGGCTAKVTQAISSLQGVSKVDVSLAKHTAEVTFDETMVSVERMGSALRAEGYEVTSTPEAASRGGGGCCS